MADFLYREFCNHVYLGQWELARGCATTLMKLDGFPDEKEKLISTLRNLAKNSSLAKASWTSLTCPSYVCFLSCCLLQELCSESDIEHCKKNAEFNIMVETLLKVPESVTQELSRIYFIVSDIERFSPDLPEEYSNQEFEMSEECISALQEALHQDPLPISLIISKMCCPFTNNIGYKLNTQLWMIFSHTFSNIINSLKLTTIHSPTSPTSISLLESTSNISKDNNLSEASDLVSKLLLLLSLIPECLLHKEGDMDMDKLLISLVNLCKSGVLSTEEVYRVLLGRSMPYLLQCYSEKEDELKVNEEQDIHRSGKYTQIMDESGVFSPQNALLSSLKSQSHFLQTIIDFSVGKILGGNYEEVWHFLQGTVFNRLQPLLLIASWMLCKDDASAMNVITATKLWTAPPDCDPALVKACKKFQFNIDVAKRFTDYFCQLHPYAEETTIHGKTRSIVMQLQTQSPLQVINRIFGMRNLSPAQVSDLLNIPEAFNSKETKSRSLHMADQAIYSGYLVITMVLEAIYFCCEFRQLMIKRRQSLLNISYETDDSEHLGSSKIEKESLSDYFQKHGPQATYSKFIVSRLEQSRAEIKKIFPIEFRVEILENIFSTLFLTPNDLSDAFESHTDSDQGCEGEDKRETSPGNAAMSLSPKSFDSISLLNSLSTMTIDQKLMGSEDRQVIELSKKFSGRFVISTIKLKDSDEGRGDFSEVHSGHTSSKSTTESNSSSGFQSGTFLCNELITRDLLSLLKDALAEAGAEMYKINRAAKGSYKSFEQIRPNVLSSISSTDLPEHMSQLLQFVSEANWRYEVVKTDIFQEPNVDKYGTKSSLFQGQCSMSSSDGNDKEPKRKRKRKHHKHTLHRSISHSKDTFSESSIIQCMLSSSESLLRHSLWSKNLVKAEQVIESFNLQATAEAKEVALTKGLHEIAKKLSNYEKSKVRSPKKEISPIFKKKSNFTNIMAISEAASVAMKTTEIGLVVDQQLSLLTLPSIEDLTGGMKHSELVIGAENIHSIIMSDLAYSPNSSFELSLSLFDMAIRRWHNLKYSTKKNSIIRGNFDTIVMMKDILKEFCNLSEVPEVSNTLKNLFWPLSQNPNSFPESLCFFLGSLDSKKFKNQVSDWKNASTAMEEFSDLLLNENHEADKDLVSGQKLHESYKQLIKCVQGLRLVDSVQSKRAIQEKYLKKLFVHLHQVTAAILECKRQSISTGSVIYTSYFSILRESPAELLKKIIFQGGVKPEKIEHIADSMKVNLAHILTQAFLPYVPLVHKNSNMLMNSKSSSENDSPEFPLLILNDHCNDWSLPRHPDRVARELLTDLLAMIQDTAMANDTSGVFSIEALISLSKHSELPSWMEECSELAHVNLDLLQSRQEKLAFFVNVSNLAWLHAILYEVVLIEAQEENINNLPSDYRDTCDTKTKFKIYMLSPLFSVRLAMQKSFGYSVGQLGFISLFDLRYQILHGHFPTPKHLDVPPFNTLLNGAKPFWEKVMPPPESRLIFVLTEGFLYSPKLKVMFSENIDDILEEAMKDFFDHFIHVDVKNEVVLLPTLLQWYASDFSKDDELDLDKAPFEGLVNLLSTLVGPSLADAFQTLLSEDSYLSYSENIDSKGKKQLPFSLKFRPPSLQFGIALEYMNISDIENTSKPTDTPLDIQDSTVIDYIKKKCSILIGLHSFTLTTETPGDSVQEPLIDAKSPIANYLTYFKEMQLSTGTESKYAWFVSALSPAPDENFLFGQIEACFYAKKWDRALFCIDSYIEHYGSSKSGEFVLLKQMTLEHLASLPPGNEKDGHSPWCYALCIENSTRRANTVLQNVSKWPEGDAVQALKFCLSDPGMVSIPALRKSLKTKLREVNIYKKISAASEMHGNAEAKDSVYVFSSWQEVADCSIWDQYRILEFIKSCGKYELLVEWVELHTVDSKHKMTALSMELIWLLSQNPVHGVKVVQILDSLKAAVECLEVCELVLVELSCLEGKLHIVQHLVGIDLELEKQSHYFNMLLGLKMLLALKSHSRDNYADLVAHPYLLLEEMLMNIELKEAEQVLMAITDDLKSENFSTMSPSSINQLVEDYASKSLEVHFLDALLESSSSSTLILSTEETFVSDEPFVMPVQIPKKEDWVPDAKIHTCQVCKEEHFNMFSRRHHCRRCGRVVCGNCSQHALIVEGYGKIKVRVCDDCYNTMTGSLSLNTASFEKRFRILSSMKSPSPRNSPLQQDNAVTRRRASSIYGAQSLRWILSSDLEQNSSVRNEFSYDHAPSISLCFSILKLHNDPKRCAQFMLNLCDRLLGKIKPKQFGKLSTEVDYNLMISMIKSLLVNARVKCYQVHNTEALALVDLYFQHLDVIKLLVNANCRHLVPREAFTSTETVRKLRDRLLEEERMNLALEISTKFNLEKNGVWSTWGLFCLMAGDWKTAREKFQQCLKKSNDKNIHKQESPVLQKILRCLEKSKCPGVDKKSVVYKSLSSLGNIQAGLTQFKTEESGLDENIKKECVFYLHTYGSHLSMVAFFQRHSLIQEALDYILDQKCETEIFVEALFMPALKYSQFYTLKCLIASSDPTLTKWWHYLFGICRYLERIKFLNVLYEMQLFMEDYIRAAKSCIAFYLAPADSYKTLADRQQHMLNAGKHFQRYLEDIGNSNGKRNKNVLSLPQNEVESYIQTIKLQNEVTSFFQLCDSQSSHSISCEPTSTEVKSHVPPTLFGNTKKKAEVAVMVLVNSVNFDEGFDLAAKIIQIYNISAIDVLTTSGKELVSMNQCQHIPHFLNCVKCCFKTIKVDEVTLECISAISKQGGDVDDLIKMLNSDSNKINAYLMCGKLKSAYLLAIKLNSALDLRRIMLAAEQCGQDSVQQFCKRWLDINAKKLKPKSSASNK